MTKICKYRLDTSILPSLALLLAYNLTIIIGKHLLIRFVHIGR